MIFSRTVLFPFSPFHVTVRKLSLIHIWNWKRANELNARLTNLYQYMELEPFPGPVKVALGQMGYFGGVLRKPLTMPSQELSDKVTAELKKLGAIS